MRLPNLILICFAILARRGVHAFSRRTARSTRNAATYLFSSPSPSSDAGQSGLSRRQVGELAIAATGLGITALGTREVDPTDYGLWGILPVGTYKSKKTIRETIVPGKIWTFDQKFGILNVQVPLRMTIIRMKDGLFVYNPIAATPECVGLVRELEKEYGPVRHVVVGSVALEHKAYAGVFAQKFKQGE